MAAENVLLLGANTQSMLTLAKLLQKRKVFADVVDWLDSPVKYSSKINNYYRLSDIEENAEQFVADLINIISNNTYNFLIPVNDFALEVCVHYRKNIEKHVKIVGLPDDESYQFCHDKYQLINICKELGINYPKTLHINSLSQLDAILPLIQYPVILKPVSSKLIFDNRLYSFNVKKIYNEEQLIDEIREKINVIPLMIQEVIDGTGAGLNALCRDGKMIMVYQHQRITEPVGGGASSYRKTAPVNDHGLYDISRRLFKAIKWNTLGMLEYKICHGVPYIMELNGRYWGSIELGRAAGIDIPAAIIDEALSQKKIEFKTDYKQKYARNLFLEFKYLIHKVKHTKSVGVVFQFFSSIFKGIKHQDIIEEFKNFDLSLVLGYFVFYLKKVVDKLKNKYLLLTFKINALTENIPQGAHIVYICYGNICRSPFAEYYSKSNAGSKWQFSSRGINKSAHRFSPVNAVTAATTFEVDMNQHTSQFLNHEECQLFDFFVVMDKKNYLDLVTLYKIPAGKIFFLSENEIADPFSHDIDTFVTTYSNIKDEIDKRFKGSVEFGV